MSADPKLRQEVYGDGDNVTGNAMEPGGWSLSDDAHKPGRLWCGKSFWLNPVYEAAAIEKMFAKCHSDFSIDPSNTSYLIVVPYLPTSSWYKSYAKYYEHVKIYPKGSIIYSTKVEGTYRTDELEPAGDAGNAGRVFIRGTPWPVVVLYRNAYTVPKVDPALLAHFRFGHVHCRRIDALTNNGIPTGMNLEKGDSTRCDPAEGCATCKLAKLPRPGAYRRGDPNRHQDLDVNAYISTDISGPLSPESENGYRYIIVFVDRSSGYSYVYFMKAKSEAVDMLNEFLDDIKQMDKAPAHMTIKSDAEAVYVKGVFHARCRQLGIATVNSPPHVHEQNGNAEKLFRDLGDMARAMMAASGFPASAWPLAYRHANWLRNRLPAARLDWETPYSRMFGEPYDLSGVRVFGCRAFVHVPPGDRDGKLSGRSVPGLYVGHDDRSSAYLVYFPDATNREDSVRVVGQPVFIEDVDLYASRLVDRTYDPGLPTDPTEIHRVRPAPFFDDIDSGVKYAVTKLGAWYTEEDHELIALVQVTAPDVAAPFWTPLTGFLSATKDKAAAFKTVRVAVESWHRHGTINSFYPLFSAVSIRSGGGRGAPKPAIITAVDTSRVENKQTMYTVVYNPECHLQRQDVPASRVDFDMPTKAKLGAVRHPHPKVTSEPKTYLQAMSLPDADMWDAATHAEMKSIEDMNVFDYGHPPPGAAVVGSMFVYKKKLNPDGSLDKYKARLVAFGHHQLYGETFTETFAPGTQISSSRLILILALQFNLTVHHLDVRTAYLQSEFSNKHEDIWIRLPAGFKSKCGRSFGRVLKPLYGFRQAGREWYLTNRDFILNHDPRWRQSAVEAQLYYIKDPDTGLFCVVLVHTDDYFGICNDDEFWDKFEHDISERFHVELKGELSSMLQMSVTRVGDTFELHQRRQIEAIIEEHNEDMNSKTVRSPMEKGLNLTKDTEMDPKLPYRQLLGQLLWIARCTRPDILFPVQYLSQFAHCAAKDHWTALVRVLRYLKSTINHNLILQLHDMSTDHCDLTIETDSDWAGDHIDRKSFSGSCVFYNGALLNYLTSKQATVSTSSTEAEYIAASEAVKEGLYFRNLINELVPVRLPIKTYIDNIGAGFIAQNDVNNARTKHIDVRYHLIRDWVSKGVVELFNIDTKDNRADMFTKALGGPLHQDLSHRLLNGLRG